MNPLGNITKEVMVEALHKKGMIICTCHARGLWKAINIHAASLVVAQSLDLSGQPLLGM